MRVIYRIERVLSSANESPTPATSPRNSPNIHSADSSHDAPETEAAEVATLLRHMPSHF